ncbi:unnamed protein product [Arctia plantaginis]|uniref:Uncharacterized protein n=1 Tax=Arctia plantaginis TaxID=874455 RepID=A0A8S1BC74_ARCPL|nr:unnamed protein product [Arctia plantaginis]
MTNNATMNLKLNNDVKSSINGDISSDSIVKDELTSKRQQEEERRRTGRYIAILVGILLFILAIYHAWIRKIPVVASLVVPALIMFVYVAWVLYTASRDKHKFHLFDVEMGSSPTPESEGDIVQISELTQNNVEISVVPTKEGSNLNSPEEHNWTEISSALLKDNIVRTENNLTLPIILVNDKPPEDLDQNWLKVVEVPHSERLKCFYRRRKFKRRYCRSRRNAAFKRSYSIG